MLLPEDIIETLPGYCYWKERPAEYIGCNSNLADLAGRKRAKQMIGVSDFDTPWEVNADKILADDSLCFSGKELRLIEPQIVANNRYTILYTEKKPHINKLTQTDGIVCYSIEVNKKPLLDLLANWVDKDNKTLACTGQSLFYHLEPCYERHGLSQRESECLFFVLRGLSANKIAARLNLSKRTVETYLENVKNKFVVDSKTELIVKAVSLGLLDIIPSSLLNSTKL